MDSEFLVAANDIYQTCISHFSSMQASQNEEPIIFTGI